MLVAMGRWGRWLQACCVVPAMACGEPGSEPAVGEGGSSSDGAETIGASESTDDEGGEGSSETGEPPGRDDEDEPPPGPTNLVLMESVVFYDGYAPLVDEPVPDGLIRISNSIYATRLSYVQLDAIQSNLRMQVLIGALCDNYDRIGSVGLALVPRGAASYDPAQVDRLELARFITPFMDKNQDPDTVPYEWDIDHVSAILGDPQLRAEYDFWFELDVFGVPYAANTEISGCEGRSDVFRGWLALYTDSTDPVSEYHELIPLAVKQPFNNYQKAATDELGTTRRTFEITLPESTEDARVVLITSNHGANAGGEEYNRRDHFVYLDGALALQYKPGRDSCEPFRVYNTQGNGIYGPAPKSDAEWQSFSNWCPGDVIDTRVIEWGAVAAGTHELVIEVPDAVFVDAQGDIPLSLYVQMR